MCLIIIVLCIILITYFTYVYYLQKDNIVFLHVGKTGGSYLDRTFGFSAMNKRFHCTKPIHSPGNKYVTLVRDPLDRTVSAFNMHLAAIKEKEMKSKANLDLYNGSVVTQKNLKRLKTTHFPWKTVNDWAEELFTTERANPWNMIKTYGGYPALHHIKYDHRFYLKDIPKESIIFVGRNENMEEAKEAIGNILGQKGKNLGKVRENKIIQNTYLSPKGRSNLMRALKDEYDFLEQEFGIKYDNSP